jgi:polysaccharide biosynthesis/export protein
VLFVLGNLQEHQACFSVLPFQPGGFRASYGFLCPMSPHKVFCIGESGNFAWERAFLEPPISVALCPSLPADSTSCASYASCWQPPAGNPRRDVLLLLGLVLRGLSNREAKTGLTRWWQAGHRRKQQSSELRPMTATIAIAAALFLIPVPLHASLVASSAAANETSTASTPDSGKTATSSSGTIPDATTRQQSLPVPRDGYVIGPDDVLHVAVWKEPELTSTLLVRTDGKISLPLLNDVVAAGLTPMQLAASLTEKLKRFIDEPRVTVVVAQMNHERVYVVGEVQRHGPIAMVPDMTVLQVIATCGLTQFANTKKIYVLRSVNGAQQKLPVNYKRLLKGQAMNQNIALKEGDTIVVP